MKREGNSFVSKATGPLTLQFKIFISFSLFFVVVTLLGMVYFSAYSIKTTNEQLEKSFQKTTDKTAESMKTLLAKYEATSKLISGNLIIAKELENYKNLTPSQMLKAYKRMYDIVNSFTNTNNYSVKIYLPEYQRFLNDYTLFFPIKEEEFLAMVSNSEQWLIKNPQTAFFPQQPFFGKLYPIYGPTSFNRKLGLISIGINENDFRKVLDSLNQVTNTEVCLLNSDGSLILSTAKSQEESLLYPPQEDDMVSSGYSMRNVVLGEERYLKITQKIEGYDFYVTTMFLQRSLFDNILNVLRDTAWIAMVFIFFILAISYLISKGVSTRMKVLTKKMSEYSLGREFVPINDSHKDDIGILSNTYDALVIRNNALIEEVYVADVKQKQAQINFLRAQINPHFLYNTLNIINCMAAENRSEDTSAMILALSNFLRLSLTSEKTHSISCEIQHASSYVAICNYRFANRIKLAVNISGEILEMKIPPLTFQPIVENCILHGIDSPLNTLSITISAGVYDDTVAIEIADNGVGITPETLMKINDNMNSRVGDDGDSIQSIGLKNVQSRFKLIYGEDYGINIISRVGYGTNCIITIPLQ